MVFLFSPVSSETELISHTTPGSAPITQFFNPSTRQAILGPGAGFFLLRVENRLLQAICDRRPATKTPYLPIAPIRSRVRRIGRYAVRREHGAFARPAHSQCCFARVLLHRLWNEPGRLAGFHYSPAAHLKNAVRGRQTGFLQVNSPANPHG